MRRNAFYAQSGGVTAVINASACGVIETAGAYLRITSGADLNLPAGLGARHQAAAGISAVTRAIAVTVSQSTGIVSIFRNGILVMEIERPHGTPSVRRPG